MSSAKYYKEIYMAASGGTVDELPDEIAEFNYHQLVVYSENDMPEFIDIEGKRFSLTLLAELESVDLD